VKYGHRFEEIDEEELKLKTKNDSKKNNSKKK